MVGQWSDGGLRPLRANIASKAYKPIAIWPILTLHCSTMHYHEVYGGNNSIGLYRELYRSSSIMKFYNGELEILNWKIFQFGAYDFGQLGSDG